MAKILKTRFQLRRGYEAAWEKNNPILAAGEPGFVLDKNLFKIGDGVTPWKDLPYINSEVFDEQVQQIIADLENLEQLVTNKADKSATLAGYGINDAYTKTETDTKFEGYYTKDEVDGLIPIELGVMSVSGKDAIVVTEGAAPEVSLKLNNSGNVTLSQDANGLKAEVTIPAQAEYSIVKDATSDYAATYYLIKDGVNVGAAINIPKDMVVKSGEVKELEAGVWGDAGTYIVITLANATDDKLYINAGNLIEYVTSGSAANDMIVINVDPQTHKVSASVTNGSITEAKLHSDVTIKLNKVWEEAGVAKNLIDALAGEGNTSTVKANADAITDITKDDGVIDQKITELDLANTYASFAQGEKADSALQEIKVGTGLKASEKAAGIQTISFDETAVFVFDCGDASEWIEPTEVAILDQAVLDSAVLD